MGLNDVLARTASRRASALVVEVPGWGRARCAVEAEMRRRGWRPALSPADADALVVCGSPGARLRKSVDLVWQQLPGPRARATVTAASATVTALDGLQADLADDGRQRQDAAGRSPGRAIGAPAMGEEDRPSDGDGSPNDGGMDRGGMDHGGMDMAMPGGVPLAGGAGDRDGLEMDVLHLPLGPVLPSWPPGLLLRCTVSGDVVTDADAEVLEPAGPAPADAALLQGSPPDRLDRASRLLTLAGWGGAAGAAARLRDELFVAARPADLGPALDRLSRRVSRSRLLRWSLSGRGRPDPLDPHQRLLSLFRDARGALTGSPTALAPTALRELPALVVGRQLSSVRLAVAAAELDTATLVRAGAPR